MQDDRDSVARYTHRAPLSADVKTLKERLRRYYSTNQSYYVAAQENNLAFVSDEESRIFGCIPAGGLVLDVACGTGENALALSPIASRYVGVDISPVALAMARSYASGRRDFHIGDMTQLPYRSGSFDAVVSKNALEHCHDPRTMLDEMCRVCKPGGKIIILAPNWEDPFILPPPLAFKMSKRPRLVRLCRRLAYGAHRIRLQMHLLKAGRFVFETIEEPELDGDFESDIDTVYPVMAREVANYLQYLGMRIMYLRSRNYVSLERPFFRYRSRNANIFVKNFAKSISLFKYGGGLRIIAENSECSG
ncbi:MAG: class I SAM-dependent methyltransferase [Dehalococcoidia bacterium]|nr:class I SAM-dependent methyltransferase [Dehalococcoidia bacterium]